MREFSLGRRVAVLCGIPLIMWACSLPTDDNVTPINADQLPPALANTTTTSTTTTIPSTEPPDTSEPTETVLETTTTTTTTPPVQTRPVDIFYTDNATDGIQGLRRLLFEPVTLEAVIFQLETPPTELAQFGVGTALAPNLIADTALERGVLTVSLNSTVFDTLGEDQKREAIAQMVLTFTSFAVPGAGNIGSVIVQVDQTPIPVFIPADGTTREAGLPVVYADFATLVIGAPGSDTTSTPPPPSTEPPPETTATP
jgi:hypothetical protein